MACSLDILNMMPSEPLKGRASELGDWRRRHGACDGGFVVTDADPAALVRRVSLTNTDGADADRVLTREWLVTNGLGGYASGTVAGGVLTRRYHGMLIAALPAPLGRTVMLSRLTERIRLPDRTAIVLSGGEHADGRVDLGGLDYLREFRLEAGLPVWRYAVRDWVLEKSLVMPHHQNTVHVTYKLLSGSAALRLVLRPCVDFRPHHAEIGEAATGPCTLTAIADRYEVTVANVPPLRMQLRGGPGAFTVDGTTLHRVFYRVEAGRGYAAVGDLWSPGYFRADLPPGGDITLVASTESWETLGALTVEQARKAEWERRQRLLRSAPPAAREGAAAELVLAADQFVITPAGRVQDAARSRAAGDEARTIIAGYHWFTDWGRDTMISLEGLGLVTGRHAEAGSILRTFAYHVRDGLIPNMFPEGDAAGRYHTADATLWFFHAIDRYVTVTADRHTLRALLPLLTDIIEHQLKGTRFGIGVDARDGLLHQGEEGYQLTWMDAKVGDWVVTPRRGKAVEINALWYNALRLVERWLSEEHGERAAQPIAEHAERARASFNERFWYGAGGYLYDVVDGEHGNDAACRPNQLLAISLPHPVLEPARWRPVLDVVCRYLLTPVGLRSLAPGHPDYRARYDGDLRARDAAYHQGTVWPWLVGPLIDAWLRVHGDAAGARRLLDGLIAHLDDACLGQISEIFDAEPPFTPRGCVAQAWSVAEVLRGWVKTAGSA
jgi:predicted glycogen debranching enzyme